MKKDLESGAENVIFRTMHLPNAIQLIAKAMQAMDLAYTRKLFDEWAIVCASESVPEWLLHYEGSRQQQFQSSFKTDFRSIGKIIGDRHLTAGDFEFSREGEGTGFDAILALGGECYLICNNTVADMQDITQDPLWRSAQVPFVSLSEKFQMNPLVL